MLFLFLLPYNRDMERFKEELKKIKPLLLLASYVGLLFVVLGNIEFVLYYAGLIITYLNPFFYGLIIAFVLNIPMIKIEKLAYAHFKKDSFILKHIRGISITLSVILALIIISIVMMMVLPELFTSFVRLVQNSENYFNSAIDNILKLLAYFHIESPTLETINFNDVLKSLGLDYSQILSTLSSFAIGTGAEVLNRLTNIGSTLFNLFMGFMISLYMLGSKEALIRKTKLAVKALIPDDIADEILRICDVSNEIFKDFVGGKLVESIVVGVLVYVLMIICGVPYAILIATLCGVVTVVPVVGSLIATIIACLLLLSINPLQSLIFFIIYQVVMNVDGNFIYPKFIGKSLGLPAIWILVSVLFFGSLLGPLGMLIAVPLTASIYTLLGEHIIKRLKKKGIDPAKEI